MIVRKLVTMWFFRCYLIVYFSATIFGCTNDNFAPRHQYTYDYELKITNNEVETPGIQIGLQINCSVRVLTKEQCQFTLFVDRCALSELEIPSADGKSKLAKNTKSDEFSFELSKYSSYFNLTQENVENLSFHEHESVVAANFKRGIISSLLVKNNSLQANESSESPVNSKARRNDVQGSCESHYQYGNHPDAYTMIKDLKTCHFPSKTGLQFSPWSLFWNMSFIQSIGMNSSYICDYELTSRETFRELKSVNCNERHSRTLGLTAQTNIKQKLTLIESKPSDEWKDMSFDSYLSSSIHYQHEKRNVPVSNRKNAEETIKGLIKDVATDLANPDFKEKSAPFGELIDLLRITPSLENISRELIECFKSQECITPMKMHKIQIYRDALFQCHRVHCFRSFRQLINASEQVLPGMIIDDYYLFTMLESLRHGEIFDTTYIKEIKELCIANQNMQKCVIVLTSIVQSLWSNKRKYWTDKSKIPSDIVEVLDYLYAQEGKDNILRFQIVGTIGDLLELYKPDIIDVLFQQKYSNLNGVPRIEATRRLNASSDLYEKLLLILKDEINPQEERVSAYLALVEKWPNSKFLMELNNIVNVNTTDYNLKTFIYSHLLTLTRSTNYNSANFSRNMLTYMLANLDPLESLVTRGGNSRFDEIEKFVSIPFLSKSINRAGFRIQDIHLFDGETPGAFYVRKNITVQFLGKEHNLVDTSLFMQGLNELQKYVRRLTGASIDVRKSRNLGAFVDAWPYEVDSDIVARLNDIRKKITDQLKSPKPMDFLLSLKELGNDNGFFGLNNLEKFVKRSREKLLKAGINGLHGNRPTTLNAKIIEAEYSIPTSGGIPLKWSTDAYLMFKSERKHCNLLDNVSMTFDYRFGVTATLRNRILVDIPGYTGNGIQRSHSLKAAFNGMIDNSVSIGLPLEPAYIRFDRKNLLIRGDVVETIPELYSKRVNYEWCSSVLEYSVGLQLCHSSSYPTVSKFLNSTSSPIGGDWHWNYTLRNVRIQRTVLSFKKEHENNDTFNILIIIGVDTYKNRKSNNQSEILRFSENLKTGEKELQIGLQEPIAPHAKLGWFIKYDDAYAMVSLNPENQYVFNHTTRIAFWYGNASDLRFPLPKEKHPLPHPISTLVAIATLKTPKNHLYNYTRKTFMQPERSYEDRIFNYTCGLPCNSWLKDVLPLELWDDYGNAWLSYHYIDYHRENYINLDIFNSVVSEEIKTPKSFYECKRTTVNNLPGVDDFYHINLTKNSLPNSEQQTFLNISFGRRSGQDVGFNWTHHLATLSVPQSTFLAGFKRKEREGHTSTHISFLRLPNDHLPGSKSFAPVNVLSKSGFEFDLIYKDGSAPTTLPWSNYKSNATVSYTFPGEDIHQITYNGQMTRTESNEWNHQFEAKYDRIHVILNSETSYQLNSEQNDVVHVSNLTLSSGQVIVDHQLNITKLHSEPPGVYHINQKIASEPTKTNAYLNYVHGSEFSKAFDVNEYAIPKFIKGSIDTPFGQAHLVGYKVHQRGITAFTFTLTRKDEMRYTVRMEIELNRNFPDNRGIIRMMFRNLDTNYVINIQRYSDLGIYVTTANRIGNIFLNDPDQFIGESILDLHDQDLIAHSLTINTNEAVYSEMFARFGDLASWIPRNPNENHYLDVFENIIRSGGPGPGPVWNSISEFLRSFVTYFRFLSDDAQQELPLQRFITASHIPWLWENYNGTRLATQLLLRQINIFNAEERKVKNGTRFDEKIEKLFSFQPDNGLPYLRPDIYRMFLEYVDVIPDHYHFGFYHKKNFDRTALLFDNKNVMTFDRHFVRDVASSYSHCPFLLTTDVISNRFSIYVSGDDLYFLFPDLHLRISPTGEVSRKMNDAYVELPFEFRSDNGEVYITRGSLTSINTEYDLHVRCADGLTFCLFSSTNATFGNLAGLLGNNNHNPQDDIQPFELWNLSKEKNCSGQVTEATRKKSDVSCNDLFGNYYNIKAVLQCMDVINPYPFQVQCEQGHGDPCATGAAFLALCGARYKTYIASTGGYYTSKGFPQCSKCHGHSVGQTWKEAVEKNVEIVFIINRNYSVLVKSKFIANLRTLAKTIDKMFLANKYQTVKFGLITQEDSNGYRVKGKLLYSIDEFFTDSVSKLFSRNSDIIYKNETNLYGIIDASQFKLDPRAVHITVLISENDPLLDEVYRGTLEWAIESNERRGTTLYSFTHYPDITEQSSVFGIRSNGSYISQFKNESLHTVFNMSYYGIASFASRGSIFFLSHLDTDSNKTSSFIQTVAEEMVTRANQDTQQCRICTCRVLRSFSQMSSCYFTEC